MKNKLRPIYHILLSWLGSVIYGNPSKEIFVFGVTGTKGKTTLVELVNAGLEANGDKTAICSSIRFKIGDKSIPNKTNNTMPGKFFIQKFLRDAVNVGCKYALIEVTSEGIRQFRHSFIDFNAAMLLNLHPEHIESHGSFENYRNAKLQFFKDVKKFSSKNPKYFFVNRDDSNANYFVDVARPEKAITFTKSNIKTKLLGEFYKENIGAAETFLKTVGISQKVIEKALGNFEGVPGRLEFIQREPFAAVVDYAHTPDSLEAVYKTLTEIKGKGGKLICVLGSCGGGRDKWKRPKFGEVASKYCSEIILTNEDPYDENPLAIIGEIKSGISKEKLNSVREIVNRVHAIKFAVSLARKGDVVVSTGKGSELYMHVANNERIPWSEKKIMEEAIIGIK